MSIAMLVYTFDSIGESVRDRAYGSIACPLVDEGHVGGLCIARTLCRRGCMDFVWTELKPKSITRLGSCA